MKAYRTKARKISGTDFHEVRRSADSTYQRLRSQSKRRTYVRSAYFKKEKIFVDLFWTHLFEKKSWEDRTRRLKLFPAAIELIRHSHFEPTSKENPNKRNELLHRFAGVTSDDDVFFVQIKENKASSQKYLISVFPER